MFKEINKYTNNAVKCYFDRYRYLVLSAFILIFAVLVAYPLFSNTKDMWDGVIVDHAARSGHPEIFGTWFNESGWPLVTYLYESIYAVSRFVEVDNRTILNMVITLSLLLSALEVYWIARKSFGLNKLASQLGATLVLAMPAWALYLSSVFLMHAFFMYLCLLGSRLYLERKTQVLGAILVLLSFQHNSNPVMFFGILAGAYIFSGRKEFSKDTLMGLASLAAFIAMKTLFPAHGLYEGYNSISFKNLARLELFKQHLLFFSYYYSPLVLALSAMFFAQPRKAFRVVIFAAVVVLNCLPYFLVGKYPILGETNSPSGYSYRCVINLCIMMGLLFAVVIDASAKHYNKITRAGVFAAYCMVFLVSASALFETYAAKARALLYQDLFIESLQRIPTPRPGSIFVKNGSHMPAFYEVNYYFYMAYGKAAWFYYESGKNAVPGEILRLQKYKDKYVSSEYQDECDYSVTIKDNLNSLRIREYIHYLYGGMNQDIRKKIEFKLDFKTISCTSPSSLKNTLSGAM